MPSPFPLLTIVTMLPAAAALLIGFAVSPDRDRTIRFVTLGATALTFVGALAVLAMFKVGEPGFQLVERVPWIPQWGIDYQMGIDGITLPLLLLTTFILPFAVLGTWDDIRDQVKGFYVSVLVLETAVLGVFLALDLILFYAFFEVMLVPMYLLIGIWGGSRRRYAAIKFFLYSFFGSLLMLVAILYLYFKAGATSFDYEFIRAARVTPTEEILLFLAFFAAFAIKLPLWPFHTWLPDAHTEAPTIGSVDLAAILLKIGGYGIIRFLLPYFPYATRKLAPVMIALSVIAILYGAIVSTMQPDIKRLVAYSSVSHMGFVALGLFALNPISGSGSVVQMVNHGLSTGALFILVGFLYQRTHSRRIAEHSGLLKATPIFGALFLVVALSSLGLPGLNGFVGEFPILLGTYQSSRIAASLGTLGVIFAALYLLWAYQRMFHGKVNGLAEGLKDLTRREILALAPLVAMIVLIGVYPQPIYDRVTPTMEDVVATAISRAGPLGKKEQIGVTGAAAVPAVPAVPVVPAVGAPPAAVAGG